MSTVRKFVRKIPFALFLYRKMKSRKTAAALKLQSTEDVFTNIYRTNSWNGKESISGSGSDRDQTNIIASEIPNILKRHNIKSILDIPSGDFNWMQEIDLSGISYIGADIVNEIVVENVEKYSESNIRFLRLNLLTDSLPDADLILCRDCLVHFSYSDIQRALNNICSTNADYLLATTFPERKTNNDIATGQWRPLNLQANPFYFPAPIALINEGCTERDGRYQDKSLGLWSISQLRECLAGARFD
jgi:hypothetical protein